MELDIATRMECFFDIVTRMDVSTILSFLIVVSWCFYRMPFRTWSYELCTTYQINFYLQSIVKKLKVLQLIQFECDWWTRKWTLCGWFCMGRFCLSFCAHCNTIYTDFELLNFSVHEGYAKKRSKNIQQNVLQSTVLWYVHQPSRNCGSERTRNEQTKTTSIKINLHAVRALVTSITTKTAFVILNVFDDGNWVARFTGEYVHTQHTLLLLLLPAPPPPPSSSLLTHVWKSQQDSEMSKNIIKENWWYWKRCTNTK